VLGKYQAVVRRADFGDRSIYDRAQVGPFATAEEAFLEAIESFLLDA
jgi:hypothetical protein